MNDKLNQIFAYCWLRLLTASVRRASVAAQTTAAALAESGRTHRGGNARATHETRRASAVACTAADARASVGVVGDAADVDAAVRLVWVATDGEIAATMAAAAVERATAALENDRQNANQIQRHAAHPTLATRKLPSRVQTASAWATM